MTWPYKLGMWGATLGAALALFGAVVNTIHALSIPPIHLTAVYTMILLLAVVVVGLSGGPDV